MRKQMGWISKRKYQYRAAVKKRRVEAFVERFVDAMVARELKNLRRDQRDPGRSLR
jgi:hypothetical protein